MVRDYYHRFISIFNPDLKVTYSDLIYIYLIMYYLWRKVICFLSKKFLHLLKLL